MSLLRMGSALIVLSAFAVAPTMAAVPLLNAVCPGSIEVHADQGGPVYLNGREAKLKVFNENYYEVTGAGITVSISINPDGTASVSYTGKHGANGVCTVK